MEPHKTYSHYKFLSRSKSKVKTAVMAPLMAQKRMKSVTFTSDAELLKSISSQENLLDLIERENKRRQEVPVPIIKYEQVQKLPPPPQSKPKPAKQIRYKTIQSIDDETQLDPYEEQAKMARIINRALKQKELKKDPVNASKSRFQSKVRMQIYLDRQFKNAAMNTSSSLEPQKNKPRSKAKTPIPTRYVEPVDIHPTRKVYLHKTMKIYDLCQQYFD